MSQKPNNVVFITGACGFVGGFLVKKLLRETDFNLILNCRSKKNEKEENKRVLYTSVDLQNKNDLNAIFLQHKPGRIIHLAAMARLGEGEKFPDEAFRTNVLVTNHLIQLAAKYDVKTLLFVSSDLARPPVSVVGITKYLAEAAIQNSFFQNIKLITLRLPNVSFSPGSVHLIFERQIRERQPLTITHPAMTRRFISGDEAADFILYALTFGKNKDIFVADKKPEKVVSLAENMIKTSGKELEIEIIGTRPGEKLEEENYKRNELTTTNLEYLSLLTKKPFSKNEINRSKESLFSKPGFTLLKELESL